MQALVYILSFFGFGGKSLDGILGALSKLDTELEKFEERATAKHLKEEQKIVDAERRRAAIENDLGRSERVRNKVKDLIS